MHRRSTAKGAALAGRCALLAVLVGAAGGAASPPAGASLGLPELGRCVRVPTGTGAFLGDACVAFSEAHAGRFDFLEGAGGRPGFAAPVGRMTLQTASGITVACSSGEVQGQWGGPPQKPDIPQPARVSLTLHGCANAAGSESCQTSPLMAGEIATSQPLEGTLAYISGGEGKLLRVGLDLQPEQTQAALLSFACGSEAWTLTGSVIGQISPLNRMTSSFRLQLHARGSEQVPQSLRGEPPDTLTATRVLGAEARTEAAGLTLRGESESLAAQNEEPLEIKAR